MLSLLIQTLLRQLDEVFDGDLYHLHLHHALQFRNCLVQTHQYKVYSQIFFSHQLDEELFSDDLLAIG